MNIPTKDLRHHLDRANEYRKKKGLPPHISVTKSKDELEQAKNKLKLNKSETKVLELRLVDAHRWMDDPINKDHEKRKAYLKAAEGLEDKTRELAQAKLDLEKSIRELETAVKNELAMREREWFAGIPG